MENQRDFCTECRRETSYTLKKIKINQTIREKEYTVALCIEGKELSSTELAQMMDDLPERGFSTVSFVIGGSDGLPEETKKLCNYRLSFSRMTFPHQLMRVILLEQLYRALNINHNGKYHK